MKTQNNPTTTITESTRVQPNSEIKNNESSKSTFWQSVLVGGIPGILIGASGTIATELIASPKDRDADDSEDFSSEGIQNGTINEAHSVTDDMSFSEAFAAARAEVGPGGAFAWHGNVYSTYRADDPAWQEMSDEDRSEHSQHVISQVHPEPYSPSENEPEIAVIDESETISDEVENVEAEEETDEVDVHIVGVAQMQSEDGSVVDLGYGEVDGHSTMFVDNDGDGEVDTVLIDANDNQVIDEEDAFVDVQGSKITIGELEAEAQASEVPAQVDALNDDMPDYTNDADTGSDV